VQQEIGKSRRLRGTRLCRNPKKAPKADDGASYDQNPRTFTKSISWRHNDVFSRRRNSDLPCAANYRAPGSLFHGFPIFHFAWGKIGLRALSARNSISTLPARRLRFHKNFGQKFRARGEGKEGKKKKGPSNISTRAHRWTSGHLLIARPYPAGTLPNCLEPGWPTEHLAFLQSVRTGPIPSSTRNMTQSGNVVNFHQTTRNSGW